MSRYVNPYYGRPPSPSRFRSESPARLHDNYQWQRSPSPEPKRFYQEPTNHNKPVRRVDPSTYGHKQTRFSNGYNTGATSSLSRRKCMTAALVILALLLLAGLAVGLYFAITSAQATAKANLPENKVPKGYNGYYVNGVYVVPVTTKPSNIYLIYGTDSPCNPGNNNAVTQPNYPNCNQLTTHLGLANWTTTTTAAVVTVSTSGPRMMVTSWFFHIVSILIMFTRL